uniref:Uncharacterized protein n=1 Tax=viral metagenome TaxID=1070528 RepID=A0A6M3X622_9ZZZZ
MSEYIIEVVFECDMQSEKEQNQVVKRMFIRPGDSVGIPEPDQNMKEHGFIKTDLHLIRVEIYRNIRFH